METLDRCASHRPILFLAKDAHADGRIRYTEDGRAVVILNGKDITVSASHQYDLVPATLFGLNERLTLSAVSPVMNEEGHTLRDLFNEEWERYTELVTASETGRVDYGWYAYYPEQGDLVRFADPVWHHVVATASSSMLLSDPQGTLSWKEVRETLRNTTVAVAGCSVGSAIAHGVAMDLRPAWIKVADKSIYKMENINRVRLGYAEMVKSAGERRGVLELGLRNKAEVVAKQLYDIDPFMNVAVYAEGISEANILQFLDGDGIEPRADLVVEEIDDPKMKLFIREEARKRGIPLLMVTDIGSATQVDLLRYDLDPALPLTYGTTDDVLYEKMNAVYDHPGDRNVFFHFVDALIGTDYRQDELARILNEQCEIPTSTIIPQLGSTAALGGAVAAEMIARLRLGHLYPPRMILDKQRFVVKKYT